MDLDDTSNCPVGFRCESCGGTGEIKVSTASTAVGVLCLSLCPPCSSSTVAPPVPVGTAVRLVIQHCFHLGIDADEMAAAMDEQPASRSVACTKCRVYATDDDPCCSRCSHPAKASKS